MLKRTHTVVGMACALSVLQPDTWAEILTAVVAGSIGAQIPDIDSATSESHREADLICLSSTIILCGAVYCDSYWNFGLISRIHANSNYLRILLGVFGLIGLCAYGKEKPHRSFMHSLLGILATTACVGIAVPIAAPWFAIGYASHIFIDLFNKKKVRLLYPYKKGVSFNLCKSNGLVNKLLGTISSVVVIIELYVLVRGL